MTRDDYTDRRKRALLSTGRGIADHLDGWSFREPPEDWEGWMVVLEGPSGMALHLLWSSRNQPGTIEGAFPKLPGDKDPYLTQEDKQRCRIGATLTRPPAVLARDIERRLLPCYSEVFERVSPQVEEAHESHQWAESLLEDLIDIGGAKPRTDSQRHFHEVSFRNLSGSAHIIEPCQSRPQGSVQLRLELPGRFAVRVLRFIAEHHPEPTSCN